MIQIHVVTLMHTLKITERYICSPTVVQIHMTFDLPQRTRFYWFVLLYE